MPVQCLAALWGSPNFRSSCCYCDQSSCIHVCPVLSIIKQANRLVIIDKDTCYECGKYLTACSYQAITHVSKTNYFNQHMIIDIIKSLESNHSESKTNHNNYSKYKTDNSSYSKFKADKCTFCNHLLTQGKMPKCVSNCISSALIFGNLDDLNAEITKL